MSRRRTDKPSAYAWVAYAMTHYPEEMAWYRKRKTPSETLIKLSEQPVGMTMSDGKFKLVCFPKSLNTRAGLKLFYDVFTRIDLHLKSIPAKAFELLEHVKATVRNRRSDTQANIHMVAEAVMHRAACEFKLEVLFAFDSINAWIKAKYNKELGYVTIRKALEILAEAKVLKINEWGIRGNRSKATKIELIPITREPILTYTSTVDDWLLHSDYAMMAVYKRESATRQNVLEKAIQHYADALVSENSIASWLDMVVDVDDLTGLFGATDGKMVEVEVTTVKETNDYFDRLLGQLVPAVQEAVPITRQTGRRVQGSRRIGESRSGP
jgi:hypothetical protein